MKTGVKKYISNLFVITSQLINTILGGAPDEMLSTRIGRNRKHPILGRIGSVLDFFDPNHIDKYHEVDMGKENSFKFKDEL
jgi:hypothetical protein